MKKLSTLIAVLTLNLLVAKESFSTSVFNPIFTTIENTNPPCSTSAPQANAAQSVCFGSTISSLVASGTALQWYDAATAGNVVPSTSLLVNGTTYFATQTLDGCEGPTTAITVTVNDVTPPPFGVTSVTSCEGATVFSLVAFGTSVLWHDAASGGTIVAATTLLVNGTNYYASQTLNGCESPIRLQVNATIINTATPVGSATQTACSPATIRNLLPTGNNITWYHTATGGTQIGFNTALTNGTYYATQYTNNCESTIRLAVALTVVTTPAPTGATTQTFCSGATVASLQAIGTAVTWYTNPFGNPRSTTTPLTNGTTYYGYQTINGCKSANALTVVVTLNTASIAPTGSIAQSSCGGATVSNLIATGTAVKWYAAASGGIQLAPTTLLVNGSDYYASQTTTNGCESTTRLAVNYTQTSILPPTGASEQSVCNAATLSDLQVFGTAIKWYATETGGGILPMTTVLNSGNSYYATQTVTGCESATRFAVLFTTAPPAAPVASSLQYFCNSGTIADITVSGLNVQWYDSDLGGVLLPSTTALINGYTYYASQTAGGCTSESLTAVNTVISLPPAAPTAAPTQTVCSGSKVANLAFTGNDIKWYTTLTGGAYLTPTTTLITATTYYGSQTINGCEGPRTAVVVTVSAPINAPFGNANQTGCGSASLTNLTPNGTAIKWYAVPTSGTVLPNTTLLTTGTFYASQTTNGCESATRLAVNVTITTVPTPTATTPQTVCNAGSIRNLVATGTGTITWYDAATGGNRLFNTTALTDATVYYATQFIGNCSSDVRLPVTVAISITPTPTGIATQTFCAGSTVASLQATGALIEWYATATGGTVYSSADSLINGMTYYASQTINACQSATRFPVAATVTAATSEPFGSANQSYCANATLADLVLTGNGIQWFDAGIGGNSIAIGTSLVDGTVYYASQTVNSCESPTRFGVTYTTAPTPAPIGASSQSICAGATLADLIANGTNIKWYDAAVGGNVVTSSTVLTDGMMYYASQTVTGCDSETRLEVTYTAAPTSAPLAVATQTFCSNASIANIVISGLNISWFDANLNGNSVATTTLLVSGTTYYASQTAGGCISASLTPVTVVVNTTPDAPLANASQTFCTSATLASVTTSGTAVQWHDAAIGGNLLPITTSIATGTTYYASETTISCESARTAVAVIVSTPAATPTGNSNQTICNSGTLASINVQGSSIVWYSAGTMGTILPATTVLISGTTYYASQTLNGCESLSRLAVAVTITVAATPSGNTSQTICNAGFLNNLQATGTGFVRWYAAATGGISLSNNTQLVNGTTYYAGQTVQGCASVRLPVVVTITIATTPTGATAQTYCAGATVTNLQAVGTAIQWYATPNTNTALAITAPLTNGTTYYATQTINTCRSTTRLMVAVTVNPATATPSGSTTQFFCSSALLSDFAVNGSGIKWYASANGGIALATGSMAENGTIYYATQTVNGCESAGYFPVTASITTIAPPSGSSNQSFNSGDTLNNLVVSGVSIQWYTTAVGGSLLSTTTPLQDGMMYYASQTETSCESPVRLEVTAHLLLGVGEENKIALSYSPNPVENVLHLNASENLKAISISNTLGQLIYTNSTLSDKSIEIDMAAFPSGTYFINVSGVSNQSTFKVIKK